MLAYDSSELADRLGGTSHGPAARVARLTTAEGAGADSIVVTPDAAALRRALAGDPAAVVVPRGLALPAQLPCAAIEVDDARLALALLSALFDSRPIPAAGVHPTAVVAADADVAPDVSVGAHSVIEAGAHIGAGSSIGPNCSIGPGSRLGDGCRLHAGVVLYDGVVLGRRATLHSGCVIGADGFGYAPGPRGAVKIHHLGGVVLGDDVEIGANAAIDRGTLEPTRVGDRTKIDNHCQIGHNVRIGSDCLIAGMTAIAGSTTVGDRVILAGYVAVADHLTIGSDVRIAARSGVTKHVPDGETWGGAPAQPYRRWVRGLYLQGKLEEIWAAVKGRDAER